MEALKIGTYNVRGLGDAAKARKVFHYLNLREYDIVFLQETHITKSKEKFYKNMWGGRIYFSNGESNARGTAILKKKKTPFQVNYQETDSEGRTVILHGSINCTMLVLVNVYGPNDKKLNYYQDLFAKLKMTEKPHIIAGDFNVILNPEMDKFGGRETVKCKAADLLRKVMEVEFLTDIWRQLHKEKKTFTWHGTDRNKGKVGGRLDLILVSNAILSLIEITKITPSFMSDHSIVYITVKTMLQKRGPGY